MSVHDGHRGRLRRQLLESGLDSFSDVQVLELLLGFAIARKDVNPLAHALLEEFGSLHGVLEAHPLDLQRVDGVGENTAALLTMMPQLLRRYAISANRTGRIITTTEEAGNYLIPYFLGAKGEEVYLLCLDAKCKVLDCRRMFSGSINNVSINVRRVVEEALRHRATSVILAHNHTSGIALPSRDDEESTSIVQAALEAVGIQLVDHIVVAGDDFVSMADSGFFRRL